MPERREFNFALYSKHAEWVELLLFKDAEFERPALTVKLEHLTNKSGRIWHCRLPEKSAAGAKFYAYRVGGPGPMGRFEWHAFDPDKILLDPYAKAIFFPPAFDRGAACRPGSNAGRAALGVVRPHVCDPTWSEAGRQRHESDLIIYELHVRGFTMTDPSVAPENRGTFRGVIEKVPYLVDLGITAVELMPVFQFDPQHGDHWGYNPMSFFAPHADYATRGDACHQHCEFREMARALHQAGIEVILDVVYNHTAEGDHRGPTYSLKGIDSSTYYLMSGRAERPYENFSGTGNTLHTANRAVRRLIIDSLRYWATEMHVDGFRFDLASILSRRSDGTLDVDDPPIFGDILSQPELAGVRLIAEPWDAGGAYQLGRTFPGSRWYQWNACFRDDLRRFVRGDRGLVSRLMTRLYGSDDLFPDDRMHSFHPWQGINFVTCHDGFTLYDLLAYSHKRNWANGHDNTDGPADEPSWNCGWEGDEGLPEAVECLRVRQAKNLMALLLLANGTAMLRAGDEFLHTQGGNSNPYNQDNEINWLNWGRLNRFAEMHGFVRRLIAFRKAHPTLCRSRFWRDDVRWCGPDGPVDLGETSHALALLLNGASVEDDNLYVMINALGAERDFVIPEGAGGCWCVGLDTSGDTGSDLPSSKAAFRAVHGRYPVPARSVIVLVRGAPGVSERVTRRPR